MTKPTLSTQMKADLGWAYSLPQGIGKIDLIKHCRGEHLTQRQRIRAMCYRCSSGYDTGKGCRVMSCPLQPLNPYVLAKCKANLRNRGEANGTGSSNPQP
jgi:hypothetical protein